MITRKFETGMKVYHINEPHIPYEVIRRATRDENYWFIGLFRSSSPDMRVVNINSKDLYDTQEEMLNARLERAEIALEQEKRHIEGLKNENK